MEKNERMKRAERSKELLRNIDDLNKDRLKRNKQEINPACLIAQLVSLSCIQQNRKSR